VELGLYHPRCKDSHKTYFPEISTLPDDKIGEYVATHEFAHSMIDRESPLKNYIGMDTKQFTKIRKEIKGIYNEYMDEISTMKLSRYSMENADEFMAEAFAQAKIGSEKGKYSDRVMEVLDKHFKKNNHDQQFVDVLKGQKIAVEREFSPRKMSEGDYAVNWDKVQSPEWKYISLHKTK
jgi:hypothetical protein